MENSKESRKVLIIEDEGPIADLLFYSLKREGYEVKTALDGKSGLDLLDKFIPDLVILDLMLPDMSGFDICKIIVEKLNIPIVMLTARCDMSDKIQGIELGADDYITKPFNVKEVIVRINAIFRRIQLTAVRNQNIKCMQVGKNTILYKEERKVVREGKEIEFTHKEFDLLLFMAENKGRVFSRSQLLDKVWGFEYTGDTRTVDIHVQRIRKKLEEDKNLSVIETVFGIGYKLVG